MPSRNKVTSYQRIEVLALLGVGFTYKNIRDKLDVSSDCINNIAKRQQQFLPLKNCPGHAE